MSDRRRGGAPPRFGCAVLARQCLHRAGPTWEANDGSRIKGSVKGRQDGGPGNIPWLLLTTAAEGNGLFGGVTSVQRLNTRGGVAPEGGCDARAVGRRVHVEYSADYHFFRRN